MRTTLLPSLLVLLALVLMVGCATQPGSVYQTPPEVSRDALKAQSLTQEAARLIHSEPDRAEKILRDALTADLYHGPAHNNLGVLYLNHGKLYEAAHEFEWAGKLMPGHPDPRMNLALTLERAGRFEEAMASYDTALEVYPNYLPAIAGLASLQLRHNLTDERTARFLEEIALRGETEEWREWAMFQMTR